MIDAESRGVLLHSIVLAWYILLAMTSSLYGEQILIIGAGVSGLTLAQILRKAGIEFKVFERDSETRPQGWSIGLDKYGAARSD